MTYACIPLNFRSSRGARSKYSILAFRRRRLTFLIHLYLLLRFLKYIVKRMDLKPEISKRKSGMMGLEYSGETVFKVIIIFL